jgi:hypothetical protein
MTGRSVAMAIQPILARQEAIERGDQVVVRACPDLDHDQTGGRVRDEDRQQAVTSAGRLGCEAGARSGQVDESTDGTGPDRQLAGVYGKMFRMASRSRPMPPPAGADA